MTFKAASKRAHEAQKALDMAGAFIKRMETLLGSKGLRVGH